LADDGRSLANGNLAFATESGSPGSYSVPFTWENTCAGSGGSGLFIVPGTLAS